MRPDKSGSVIVRISCSGSGRGLAVTLAGSTTIAPARTAQIAATRQPHICQRRMFVQRRTIAGIFAKFLGPFDVCARRKLLTIPPSRGRLPRPLCTEDRFDGTIRNATHRPLLATELARACSASVKAPSGSQWRHARDALAVALPALRSLPYRLSGDQRKRTWSRPMVDDVALNAWFCATVLPLEPALT